MRFSREIRRLLVGSLVALALLGLSASYWALAGPATILLREDNPRTIEALSRIQRGRIVDRNGELLAETVINGGSLQRRYLHPASYSAVGYASLRYGVSGAESAFDAALSGRRPIETLADYVNAHILRLPQVGTDIRLTLDSGMQAAFAAIIGDSAGAAVAMNAASGELLALLSAPSYDPNTLDDDWELLVEAPGQPFFNRALQGNYQLGGAIYSLWLAHAIEANFDLSRRFHDASALIDLGAGAKVACVQRPSEELLTLAAAFISGCPAPFAAYGRDHAGGTNRDIVSAFGFEQPFTLAGFPLPESVEPPAAEVFAALSREQLALRSALGQDELTTTPLHLAAVMSAIVNDGRAASPRVLAAQRAPGDSKWQVPPYQTTSARMLSADTAQTLQGYLSEAWAQSQGRSYAPGHDVGATIAHSQSGDDKQTWLIGFIRYRESMRALAFVVLLEYQDDAAHTIALGQRLIAALIDGA